MAEAHRIADSHTGPIRRSLLTAVARAIRGTAFPRLAEAIEARSATGVVNAIEWTTLARTMEEGVVDALAATHAAAANVTVRKWPRVINTRAKQAALRQSYDLIHGVTEESKLAIRDLVERLFNGQSTVQATGRLIRDHIGLTRQQSASLWNYQMELQEQFSRNEITAKQLVDRVTKQRDALIAHRADIIARTESMRAANQGQLDGWQQAEAEGLVPSAAKREWVVTTDERLCPICASIPRRGPVGLHEAFLDGNDQPIMAPPAHPACRCTVSLLL